MLPLDDCMPANCLQMTLKMAPNLSRRTSASVNKSEAFNHSSVSENEQSHTRSQGSMKTLAADSHMQSAKYPFDSVISGRSEYILPQER